MTNLLQLDDVWKIYGHVTASGHAAADDAAVVALRGINLTVEHGEYVAIMGSSGSGKSTLMNIIGCLDLASAGTYLLDGYDVSDLDQDTLALVRNRLIGFVFQSFHLIPRMTAQGNVELPMVYGQKSRKERTRIARDVLELVGLGSRADHRPNQLSGGQQQRVAIARALTMSPQLILADEPTGNLDSKSSHEVMELLTELNDEGKTIVLITHEDDIAAHARRVIRFSDGEIISDERAGTVMS